MCGHFPGVSKWVVCEEPILFQLSALLYPYCCCAESAYLDSGSFILSCQGGWGSQRNNFRYTSSNIHRNDDGLHGYILSCSNGLFLLNVQVQSLFFHSVLTSSHFHKVHGSDNGSAEGGGVMFVFSVSWTTSLFRESGKGLQTLSTGTASRFGSSKLVCWVRRCPFWGCNWFKHVDSLHLRHAY